MDLTIWEWLISSTSSSKVAHVNIIKAVSLSLLKNNKAYLVSKIVKPRVIIFVFLPKKESLQNLWEFVMFFKSGDLQLQKSKTKGCWIFWQFYRLDVLLYVYSPVL